MYYLFSTDKGTVHVVLMNMKQKDVLLHTVYLAFTYFAFYNKSRKKMNNV
jgi:hypothetical protein